MRGVLRNPHRDVRAQARARPGAGKSYFRFAAAKSQLTMFQKASTYFARALR